MDITEVEIIGSAGVNPPGGDDKAWCKTRILNDMGYISKDLDDTMSHLEGYTSGISGSYFFKSTELSRDRGRAA